MAKVIGAVVVDSEVCKGCNLCVVSCPTKTLGLNRDVNSRDTTIHTWNTLMNVSDVQIAHQFVRTVVSQFTD